jgi:hypothetical protein
MAFWFVVQTILKVMVIRGLYNNSCINFTNEIITFWNLLDLLRLGGLLLFIICAESEDIDLRTNTAAFLVNLSWISLLEQLRLF